MFKLYMYCLRIKKKMTLFISINIPEVQTLESMGSNVTWTLQPRSDVYNEVSLQRIEVSLLIITSGVGRRQKVERGVGVGVGGTQTRNLCTFSKEPI